MSKLELVIDPYQEGDKACIEVRFQGKVEKWSSSRRDCLRLEEHGHNFVQRFGSWYSIEPTRMPAKHDSHLAKVYERILPMLERVLANEGGKRKGF